MWLRMKTTYAGPHGTCTPGKTIELPDEVGRELVPKYADEISPPKPPPKQSPEPGLDAAEAKAADAASVEVATEPEAEEAAVRPRGRRGPSKRVGANK